MGGHSSVAPPPRVVGRYALCREIATGGMATVHLGRLVAEGGFARTVAIKRLLPQLAKDAEFSSMFLQEARLAARIRHPNVVPTLDVVSTGGELFLVMEYVHGESLAQLLRLAIKSGDRLPQPILVSILSAALQGLHAAHEATSESGEPLNLVHRDVSPQNILVDVDGVARVIDFGVAKAVTSAHTTRSGQVKGKIKYMAPEQVLGQPVTRRTDVFATGILLWEGLTGRKLFDGEHEATVLHAVLNREIEPPSRFAADVSAKLDAVVLRALQRDPDKRYASAGEMSAALEAALPPATQRDAGDWVKRVARERLARRREHLAQVEKIDSLERLESLPASDPALVAEPSGSGSLRIAGSGSAMVALTVSSPHSRRRRRLLAPIALSGVAGVAGAAVLYFIVERGSPDDGAAASPVASGTVDESARAGDSASPEGAPSVPVAPVDAPSDGPPAEAAPASAEPAASTAVTAPPPPVAAAKPPSPSPKVVAPAKPPPAKPEPPAQPPESLYSRD